MGYLAIINSARGLLYSTLKDFEYTNLSFIMVLINFLLGPLGLLSFPHITNIVYYRYQLGLYLFFRMIFLISSLGNLAFIYCALIVIECKGSYNLFCTNLSIYLICIISTVISAPLNAVYYCTFNYYIKRQSQPEFAG